MTPDINWNYFERRITIQKPLDQVYKAWAVPRHLEYWLLAKVELERPGKKDVNGLMVLQTGDVMQWQWNNWEEIHEVKVLETNHNDFIKFGFADESEVNVKISDVKDKSLITLSQSNFSEDEYGKYMYTACSNGWTFWLTNLKAWLEYGITLHEKSLAPDQLQFIVNS